MGEVLPVEIVGEDWEAVDAEPVVGHRADKAKDRGQQPDEFSIGQKGPGREVKCRQCQDEEICAGKKSANGGIVGGLIAVPIEPPHKQKQSAAQ